MEEEREGEEEGFHGVLRWQGYSQLAVGSWRLAVLNLNVSARLSAVFNKLAVGSRPLAVLNQNFSAWLSAVF